MKKNLLKILSALFVCFLILTTNVFATARPTLTLEKNQTWVSLPDTRTGSYTTVLSRLYAVYPTNGGEDNFTRVQVKVISSGGTAMSNITTLYETASANTTIKPYDGTLGNKSIKFQFRGNNPNYGAKADVYYNAR